MLSLSRTTLGAKGARQSKTPKYYPDGPDLDIADPFRTADHWIGGSSIENCINFLDPVQVVSDPFGYRATLYGFLEPDNRIEVGHKLIHRYDHHFVELEVIDVEWDDKRPNMFSAEVWMTHIWSVDDGRLLWARHQSYSGAFSILGLALNRFTSAVSTLGWAAPLFLGAMLLFLIVSFIPLLVEWGVLRW